MIDREHIIQDKSSEVVYSPAPQSCTDLGKVGVKSARACWEVTSHKSHQRDSGALASSSPAPVLCALHWIPLPPGEAPTPMHRGTPPPQGILYQQGSLRSLSLSSCPLSSSSPTSDHILSQNDESCIHVPLSTVYYLDAKLS